MNTEFITSPDQLDVYYSKAVSPEETIMEDGKCLTSIHIPSDDVQAVLKRKQRTRRVHVLSFEEWKNGDSTERMVSHMGVISNTSGKRIYKPQVHRSPVSEMTFDREWELYESQ